MGCDSALLGLGGAAGWALTQQLLRLTRASFILEPAHVVGPKNRREVFGYLRAMNRSWRFASDSDLPAPAGISAFRGHRAYIALPLSPRTGWVCLVVLMMGLSLSRVGGITAQTRWSRRHTSPQTQWAASDFDPQMHLIIGQPARRGGQN